MTLLELQYYFIFWSMHDAQQADKVIFLHCSNYYFEIKNREKLEGEGNSEHIEVVVAKNRDGKTGFVQMVYYEDWGRIEEE